MSQGNEKAVWRCPKKGCDREFDSRNALNSHIGKTHRVRITPLKSDTNTAKIFMKILAHPGLTIHELGKVCVPISGNPTPYLRSLENQGLIYFKRDVSGKRPKNGCYPNIKPIIQTFANDYYPNSEFHRKVFVSLMSNNSSLFSGMSLKDGTVLSFCLEVIQNLLGIVGYFHTRFYSEIGIHEKAISKKDSITLISLFSEYFDEDNIDKVRDRLMHIERNVEEIIKMKTFLSSKLKGVNHKFAPLVALSLLPVDFGLPVCNDKGMLKDFENNVLNPALIKYRPTKEKENDIIKKHMRAVKNDIIAYKKELQDQVDNLEGVLTLTKNGQYREAYTNLYKIKG